jgi:hypothetical protein
MMLFTCPLYGIRQTTESGNEASHSASSHTRSPLLDWLRVEYGIEKPSNKLLAVAELGSDTWE